MSGVAELLEDELEEAIEKKDKRAIKHFVAIIVDNFEEKKEAERRESDLMLKLNAIEITIKEGFASVNKRFEDMQKYMDKRFEAMQQHMDKRFEDINKRFEDMNKRFEDMNKRFEDMNKRFEEQNQRIIELREDMNQRIAELREDMNKRFEDMNKRFEDMNKRFEDMHKKFSLMLAFITIGYTITTVLIVVFKFLK